MTNNKHTIRFQHPSDVMGLRGAESRRHRVRNAIVWLSRAFLTSVLACSAMQPLKAENIRFDQAKRASDRRLTLSILSVKIQFRAPVNRTLFDRIVASDGPTIGIKLGAAGVADQIATLIESLELRKWDGEGEGEGDLRYRFDFQGFGTQPITVYAGTDGEVFYNGVWFHESGDGRWIRKVWELLEHETIEK